MVRASVGKRGSSDEACPHLQSSHPAVGASGHSSSWLEAPEKGIYGSRILTFSRCLGLAFPFTGGWTLRKLC